MYLILISLVCIIFCGCGNYEITQRNYIHVYNMKNEFPDRLDIKKEMSDGIITDNEYSEIREKYSNIIIGIREETIKTIKKELKE